MILGLRTVFVRFGYFLVSSGFTMPIELQKLVDRYSDQVCVRDLLRRLRINCVIDVGANAGQFAKNLRKLGYEGHICSFEPEANSFSQLSKAFERDTLWRGFNFALGAESAVKTFNVTKLSAESSFFHPKVAEISQVTEVQVKRLDSIFADIVEPIKEARVFLKIDTQGYDVEVLKGAGACIEQILCLQSEISVQAVYDGMPHYLDALKLYESLGFQLVDLFTVTRNRTLGNIVEYDCLMARIPKAPLRPG